MKTLPCYGCNDRKDPNCTEDCISYRIWAKAYFRTVYAALIEEARVEAAEHNFIEITYYEPCDEKGEPYKKGSLDEKFGKYGD